jgi:amino acid adenylation domain-containing protein/non-ribosomal peptide synthase protein (TIGR01720 family)
LLRNHILCIEFGGNAGKEIEMGDPNDYIPESLSNGDSHDAQFIWNRQEPETVQACIHDLITAQALSRPSAEAVCAWDDTYTYEELDSVSSRLAQRLSRQFGVGPETLVPICFEKSASAVVAMLGVLKAGGAFVPLDSSSPRHRLQEIVSQSKSNIILSSPRQSSLCQVLSGKVLAFSPRSLHVLDPPFLPSRIPQDPRNAAYVIFTSGSTGKPKGVVIEHLAFCSGVAAHGPAHNISATSRVLQFASYSFDASLVEILTTLISGGCVCIPSDEDRINNLSQVMNELRVNLAILTPSVAALLKAEDVPCLETLVLAGEPVSSSLLRQWEENRSIRLINAYGPTECSVSALVNPNLYAETQSNIGRGTGCRTWVVEESNHDRLVSVGEIGELLIEGPILARGYLNDPEKTSTVFIETPVWLSRRSRKRIRLYKTGDLARWNSDGTMEYIGRKDAQVKVRGQRVELGEIEQHLTADDRVSRAVTVWPKSGLCKRQLVAVLTLREISEQMMTSDNIKIVSGSLASTAASQVSDLSEMLAEKLPSYAVPVTWIVMESVPLLSSGKADRSKMTRWVEEMDEETLLQIRNPSTSREADTRTATQLEKQLQQIWSRVLNVDSDHIGLDQSFLNLGGDSISAMQIVGRCRSEGLQTSVQDILQSKTISKLAQHVKVTRHEATKWEEVSDTSFELSPIQRMYFDAAPHGENHFNQSFLLRLTRLIPPDILRNALEALVKRHPMLRARFSVDVDGRWTQLVAPDARTSFNFTVHENVAPKALPLIISCTQKSLDIRNGPLFACDLLDFGEHQLLFLVAHHLVVDLVSWRIIIQDLEDFIESGALSLKAPMPFQKWSSLQAEYSRDYLSPEVAYPFTIEQANYDFWGMQGIPNRHGDSLELDFTLSEDTTALLLSSCHVSLRTEPTDVFVATLIHSFHTAFPERSTPTVFGEGHGREPWDPAFDLSETVGWFTTLYPIHVPVDKQYALIDTVRYTKDIRRAIPNKGWSYFASRYLNPGGMKRFGADARMEIVFNYFGLYQQLERENGLLEQVPGGIEESVDSEFPRFSLVEISAAVEKGRLRFSFVYNSHMLHQERIRMWIATCESELNQVGRQLEEREPEYTLADFPLASLTYDSLRQLVEKKLPALGLSDIKDIEDIYPCSPLQNGILMSQMKKPDLYNTRTIWKVLPRERSGSVDAKQIQRAWKGVVDRHSSLRTIFVQDLTEDSSFYQVVLSSIDPTVVYEDWDSSRLHTRLDQLTQSEAQPPHHLTLYRADDQTIYCELRISHAIIDGLSMMNIARDISLAYDDNLPTDSGPLYSDFVSQLSQQETAPSVTYWKDYLADLEPCRFPDLDGQHELEKGLETVRLELNNTQRLREFCEEKGMTLSNLFQTAWAMVLRAYVGMDNVCFGYLASGRDVPVDRIDDAVGAFATMLICRANLAANRPVDGVLETMQNDFLQGFAHQHCSLAEVYHALKLPNGSLFNTIMSFQRQFATDELKDSKTSMEKVLEHDPTEFNVTIGIEAVDDQLSASLQYWTSSMTENQASHVLATFNQILLSLVEGENQVVGDVKALSPHSRDALLGWNNSEPEVVDSCIHDIIHFQSIEQPEAIAICAWDETWTFAQVDGLSTKVANHLILLGVRPEVPVPLCFEKSGWTIVAMIAVMKAGGYFVPMDPSHPVARLKDIVRQTGAKIILCSQKCADISHHLSDNVCVINDVITRNPLQPLRKRDPRNGVRRPSSSNAAYVLFTSGSTGTPKGVVIEHRAFCSGAAAHSPAMHIRPSSRVLQFASYSFDASLVEILSTLMVGGTVCVPSEEDRSNNLSRSMNDLGVNTAILTPSVAALLSPEELPLLKSLTLAGEAIPANQLRKWENAVHLINGYGPTECSVCAVANSNMSVQTGSSNIGSRTGCHTWVVEESNHNCLVPIGCVGELLIEGPILAREYLNDEEKTAAAFIENPEFLRDVFGSEERRMYKTGDLVRYNGDGTLVYVGRKDTQVKIRGQRVELGDVEHALSSLVPPESRVAIDFVGKDVGEHNALVAFVEFAREETLEERSPPKSKEEQPLEMTEDMRSLFGNVDSALAASLPGHMIPSLYVPVQKLPLRSSGKLDRARLRLLVSNLSPEQLIDYSLSSNRKRAPASSVEKILQRLWAEVLDISLELIGVDDSFFRTGGDSITAIKLSAAARQNGIPLTVATIFQNPVLHEMAGTVTATDLISNVSPTLVLPFSLTVGLEGEATLVERAALQCKVDQTSIEDIYPCTSLQEGLMALSVRHTGTYVAQHILQLPATLDLDRFRAAWTFAMKSVSILRTRVISDSSSRMLQVVLTENLEWRYGSNLDDYIQQDSSLPFEFGSPLVRFALVVNDEGDRYFTWTAHHAVYDAWSLSLMWRMVEQRYLGQQSAQTVPYNTFIRFLGDIDLEASAHFWTRYLSQTETAQFPKLPSAANAGRVEHSYSHRMHLSRPSSSDITTPTLLRAAWAMVVGQYSNSSDVVFGTTVSGRNASIPGITDIIGPTIVTVPVRVTVHSRQTVGGLLQGVQDLAAEMIPFEHFGLQRIMQLGGEFKQACDFQNLLVIQQAGAETDLNGLLDSKVIESPVRNFHSYPLVVECAADGDYMDFLTHFDPDILDETLVEKMMYQFEHMVNQLNSERTEIEIKDVKLLNGHDEKAITLLNRGRPEMVKSCIHDLIRDCALAAPDALAICAWDESWSYAELDNLSSQLAKSLFERGVTSALIPLCFEKSAWTIVAMLAVLKAGCTFVPLDPSYPVHRLKEIIRQTDARLILSSERYESLCDGLVDDVFVVGDNLRSKDASPDNHSMVSNPEDAAYIIFTSGSTGIPKGVVVEHQAFCSSAIAFNTRIEITASSRVLQFTSYSFDVSLAEILGTLIAGGTVCIPSEDSRRNDLVKALNDFRCDVAYLTPSVSTLLPGPKDLPYLKTLVLAGEPMSAAHIRNWAASVRLINAYGPTECSVLSLINNEVTTSSSPLNIGTGSGSICWIADAKNHSQLAPFGCVGDLLIEGPILARDYLNDPDKTASAFIEDPPWLPSLDGTEKEKRRLYKTGDLVRYNTDGSIEYMGRKDTQVKVHGQRVELGGIESELNLHLPAGTSIAVDVIAKEEATGASLVAFLRFGEESHLPTRSDDGPLKLTDTLKSLLRDVNLRLGQKLPSYMIPKLYIPVDQMPFNLAGKLDRQSLRSHYRRLSDKDLANYLLADDTKRVPSSAMEMKLQALWADVLRVPVDLVGADDSFFHIGGDSITAMRLTAAAQTRGLPLTVSMIFKSARLSEMAKMLESSGVDDARIQKDVLPFTLLGDVSKQQLDDMMTSAGAECEVPYDSIEDIYPCTPLQEGLMALSVKQPGAYIAQHVFRLQQSLDIHRFQAAWETTVSISPILRTRIISTAGNGMLQVAVKEAIDWKIHRTDNLDEYIRDSSMDIRFGAPLTRACVVEDGNGNLFFHWIIHHAVYDAWSLALIFKTVERAYNGETIAQPMLFNSFIEYVAEKNSNVDANDTYWKTYLSGANLTYFPSVPSSNYLAITDQSLRHQIQFSRPVNSGITTATFLRVAWAIVISEYSNSDDVVFGAILTGRNAPVFGVSNIVGPTITTVPVRMKIQEAGKILDLLHTTQKQSTDMTPFEQMGLQNIRHLNADTKAACDFQNLLVVQAGDNETMDIFNPESIYEIKASWDTYPLVVECVMGEDEIGVTAHFDHSIVSRTQVERTLHQFGHVLQQMNGDSVDKTLGEISTLSEHDDRIIRSWNTSIPETINSCVHDLIHQRATFTPDKPAVNAWDESFTRAELDDLSSRLAQHLRALGVGPEMMVPLCFERTAWMVVAMLGTMKAGGAFVPLDPSQLPQRRKDVIEQSRAKIVLCSEQQAKLFDGLVDTIFVVNRRAVDQPLPASVSHTPVGPNNAAYVIFTSGSTGKPKGVVIEHKAYSSSAIAHGPAHSITESSRVLQFASYSVDAICLEILTTLIMGGCVCLPSAFDRNNNLSSAMKKMGVNLAALTPSVLSVLSPADLPALKTVIVVGESAPKPLIARWAETVHLINGYGPTESSLAAVMNPTMTVETGSNIGKAVGCRTWIVDEADHDRLLPIGCVGELLIEGPTLARGYLDEPKKTAAAFITNPPWARDTESKERRLYKSGDLVKYNDDGTISFIGRKDTQVKIHGQRVELSEVEHAIRSRMLSVAQAVVEVVVVKKDNMESRTLVAFLAFDNDDAAEQVLSNEAFLEMPASMKSSLKVLEHSLTANMPAYMVPALYFPLRQMPVALSGKIDRLRLRALISQLSAEQIASHALADEEKRMPQSDMAKRLQLLWMKVLHLSADRVGLDDSFFHLGGDSIAAMKLAAMAQGQNISLTVADIFRNVTLEQMADAMADTAAMDTKELQATRPFASMGSKDIAAFLDETVRPQLADPTCEIEDVLPSTDFQAWSASLSAMRSRGFVNYLFLDFSGPLDPHRLEKACQRVVAEHPVLRTTFVTHGPEILQVVLRNYPLQLEQVEWNDPVDENWNQWVETECKSPLSFGQNILKFFLLSHGQTKQRLVIRISHAQYDGISMPRVYRSLSMAYAGHRIPASPPFSSFITAISNTHSSTEATTYWRTLLHNSSMTALNPTSTPSYRYPLDLTIGRTIPLPPPSHLQNLTLATLIKASWSLLLARLSSTTDVTFGDLTSGRNISLPSIHEIVGPCINTIPVRVSISSSWTVSDLLRYIQDQHISSLPHESAGFCHIIRECTDWPSSSRFSSVVQHQNLPELAEGVSIGGVQCGMGAVRGASDTSDVVVMSTPNGQDWKIELGYSSSGELAECAEEILADLCRLVQLLSADLDALVPELHQVSSLSGIFKPVGNRSSNNRDSTVSLQSSSQSGDVDARVLSLWTEVLGPSYAPSEDITLDTTFFDIGGDLVSAVLLAEAFKRVECEVDAEWVIEHPGLVEHVEILGSKGRRVDIEIRRVKGTLRGS